MTEKTEEEIKKAYGFARTMGRRFIAMHPRPVQHLDEDDYTQEAVLAWLEKKHIPFRLVDLYRRESPIGRRDWSKNSSLLKLYDTLNVDEMSNSLESDFDLEGEVEKQFRLQRIQEIMDNLVDPRQYIILYYKYKEDRSLVEISKRLGISKSYTSKLHRDALDIIKEEMINGGY
jgi:DNA-directed RNA polymerase specialized sigma24 family protein